MKKLHFITVNYFIQPLLTGIQSYFLSKHSFYNKKKKSFQVSQLAYSSLLHLVTSWQPTPCDRTGSDTFKQLTWISNKCTAQWESDITHQHMLEHLWWRLNHDLVDNQLLSVCSEADAFGRLWLNNLLVGLKCNWCVILGEKGHDREKQHSDSQYHKQCCCLYANFTWMYSIMMIYAGLALPNLRFLIPGTNFKVFPFIQLNGSCSILYILYSSKNKHLLYNPVWWDGVMHQTMKCWIRLTLLDVISVKQLVVWKCDSRD